MKKEIKISWAIVIFLLVITGFLIAETLAQNSDSANGANLTIWDDTESGGIKRSGWNTYFYANYTNVTSGATIADGNCTIRFQNYTNEYGNWFNMTYNSTYERFQYNRTFNYKGTYYFDVNCSNSSSLLINVTDNFAITNSIPIISKEQSADWINFDDNNQNHDTWQCTEDTACYYNFSANVSDADINDVLSYSYGTENTTLTNYTLNTTTGMLLINITNSNYIGTGKKIELKVKDNDPDTLWQPGLLEVNVQETNDAPIFVGLQNFTFNISELFEKIINVTDEENNIPFVFNITFLNCSVAEWSTRNCSNSTGRELFNSSQYSFNGTSGILNISFTPLKNDVGSYTINFSVMDNSSLGNKTTSQLVNFTVLNINSAPYFTYVCDNERNATEDSEFVCRINATDIDETNNLTFFSNYTWFKFNNSANNITVSVNISTNFNASVIVNFTPTDIAVGNWSINITVIDTGSPIRRNSTVFWFFINNTEDLPTLNEIANRTIYQNTTIYVNATDDDLLVSDKGVKNEILSFASNTSWVNISTFSAPSNVNYTTAIIRIDYNTAYSLYGNNNHTVRINVTDAVGNFAERNFTTQILGENPATWNNSKQYNFSIYENNNTYLNLSEYVSDTEGDSINFSFTSDTSFPSFSIAATGIINFTPVDDDIGQHIVTINASDGKLDSLKSFNFTVYNINDAPFIETPLTVTNATVDANSNINTTEDNLITIELWIQDNDFKIPSAQKNFYNESLRVNLTIQGLNITLFEFVADAGYPTPSGTNANRSKYDAVFTPRKSDVGSYNITINVTDLNNASSVLQFNLTVQAINHAPVLQEIGNLTSAINRIFYYRINATDIEDGNSTASNNRNFTFSYNFTYGNNIFNSSTFNSTTGEINITFNSSHGGSYHINITINDTVGATASADFWIFVYDYPNITFPLSSYVFNLIENTTSNLTFQVNHSVGDNLTYLFYIRSNTTNTLKYNISYYGNITNLTWQFTPNFTDETYGGFRNLTLIVYPSSVQLVNRTELNTTINWNLNISHKNHPLEFSGSIGGASKKISGSSPQEVTLSDYFYDTDASDSAYNQTIGFTYLLLNSSGGAITVSITNWTNGTTPRISFSASSTGTANYSITAYEYNESNSSQIINNVTSNNFSVEITVSTTPTPTPSSGGGGGATRPVLLKIILPEPVSAYQKDRIKVPIVISNEGQVTLYDINLTSLIAKNMTIRKDITMRFDKNYFSTLLAGQKENVTLTIDINTNETGLYEITINGSVKEPKYSDWGKLYLTVKETNKTDVMEIILFTEEFIAENPECIELTEFVKEARKYFDKGEYESTLEKAREAIDACRYAIAQPALPTLKEKFINKIYKYLSISLLFTIILGVLYCIYKRIKLKRGLTS